MDSIYRIGVCFILYRNQLMKIICLFLGLMLSNLTWADLPKTGSYEHTQKVEVESEGSSFDQARQNGFKQAIVFTVGSLIVSDTESSNGFLTKDQVAEYSAGYVDDYKILENRQDAGITYLKMQVTVASSRIAYRMINSKDSRTSVLGQKLYAQLKTQIEMRENGDRVLGMVMDSFPHNAFTVNQGEFETLISRRRNAYIEVPYEIKFSDTWLQSLDEALTVIGKDHDNCSTVTSALVNGVRASNNSTSMRRVTGSICTDKPDVRVFFKKKGDWFVNGYTYNLSDLKTLELLNNKIRGAEYSGKGIALYVDILDGSGATVDSRCAMVPMHTFVRFEKPNLPVVNLNSERQYKRPVIMGDKELKGTMVIYLGSVGPLEDVTSARMYIKNSCN